MWTINDFIAYRMVYGWNMHEKLAYSYCMINNKTFMLINIGKMSFYDCHWQFLSTDHKFRKDFFVGKVKKDVVPLLLLGKELYSVLSEYDDIVFWFDLQLDKLKYFLGASLLEDQSPSS